MPSFCLTEGGRDQIGMVAAIKSEYLAALRWNSHEDEQPHRNEGSEYRSGRSMLPDQSKKNAYKPVSSG
jgi:hypothetical protein